MKITPPRQIPKIAVIGAGIAGLTCALQLEKLGADVTLFEKSRGVSGRMSTRRSAITGATDASFDGQQWQFDHGAQYFVAYDAGFQAEVSRWQSLGLAQPWHARVALLGALGPAATLALPGGECANSSEQATAVRRWVGAPRMSSIASNLAKALRGQLQLETTVNALTQSVAGWQLSSVERGPIDGCFDAVLLAVPAPQAAALLHAVGAASAALSKAAVSQPMQACWAVMLRFTEPLALYFDAAAIGDGPLRWIARDNAKPGRPSIETWVLHASAEWSAANLEASADFVLAELTRAFSALTQSSARLVQATAHRWRYATAIANTTNAPSELATAPCHWQRELALGMCGDWLAGGTVEAAWLSGLLLAQLVMADLDGATAQAYAIFT